MSQDLLAEFGDLDNPSQQPSTPQFNHIVEDDFGDFERPAPIQTQPTNLNLQPLSAGFVKPPPRLPAVAPEDVGAQLSTEDDFDVVAQDRGIDVTWQKPCSDGGLDHDWGDFEKGETIFDAKAEVSAKGKPDVVDEDVAEWEPSVTEGERVSTVVLQSQPPGITPTKQIPPINAQAATSTPQNIGPPPSNIPPPLQLIALGTTILKDLPAKIRQERGESGYITYVQQAILDLQTLGRILAGRKARWKRDNILSQSMRIGEAGRQGGMKLTKVDKTETRREDQEAAEMLRQWRQQAGAMKTKLPPLGDVKLPEIAENMPVRAAKPSEGALIAPKPCFLCGLKRDERVLKLDYSVLDSFGEWWVEHWGHRGCCSFWDRYNSSLPQR